MGNTCCKKPDDELVITTLENDKNEIDNSYKKDKYPHDTDSAFKTIKEQGKKFGVKPISNENMIEE